MAHKLLIIGSGGREHALAWKLKQSPKVKEIFIAPGNAGTSQVGKNVDIKATDFDALIDFTKKEKIDLTIVGPDDPLGGGIVDAFQNQGLKIWGPSKKAAQIEASKSFAKELMRANNIPTAEYKVFTNYDKAVKYLDALFSSPPSRGGAGGGWIENPSASSPPPNLPRQGGGTQKIVIKASGLALGKGVAVCQSLDEAKKSLEDIMVKKIFGEAGSQIIIEEFLEGKEFSIHAFCDGNTFQLLPASQDHKAIFDEDKGPNTGGLGTIAPVPWVKQDLMNKIASRVIKPALSGLKKLDAPFTGLLYPGLMATNPSQPPLLQRGGVSNPPSLQKRGIRGVKVLEFNARFGDPETQSYMRLLKTDLFDILMACVGGKLDEINIEWHPGFACCIVLASGGYPGEYKKGLPITGIEEASKLDDIVIFHAGTMILDSNVVSNGGRVLGVTAIDDTLQGTLDKAYSAIKLINFDGMYYRTDIGQKSLALNNNN